MSRSLLQAVYFITLSCVQVTLDVVSLAMGIANVVIYYLMLG